MFKKGRLKAIITFLLVLTMSVGMFNISALAATGITAADKTAMKQADGTYEVKIQVPGKDGDNRHDEVILMVDGSYSLNNEWPYMKEAINTISETVLNGSGNTRLTLMAFGMGDNEVVVHAKNAEEVAAVLGALPGNLLYGRSSTNCEAGFKGVAKYIENHDDTLRDVHVIYISDGNVNTDETTRKFDTNWKAHANMLIGDVGTAQEAFGASVKLGENLSAAFHSVFGERFEGASREEILDRAFAGEITNEEFLAFGDRIFADVYAYSDLTPGTEYPISEVERAFVKYDKEHGTWIEELFYYSILDSIKGTERWYPDRVNRTMTAADALAAMNEVKSMYVVDYDSKSAWMDTGITSEKSTFIQSNGIAGLCDALKGALTTLAKTPFNDVVVTDYMSKWVNLIPDSIKIVDNKTNQEIWNVKDGWKIDADRPTAQTPPVIAEMVASEGYAAGGNDVIGNTNGDIYKLTWYVKDDAMLRSDSYSLVYNVTVDTKEAGFVFEQSYPANGNTFMEYEDENGEKQKEDIKVPFVGAEQRIINITKLTEITNADGKIEHIPLEGIEFDIYYVCTVDEYTANIKVLETPSMSVVAGKTPVATLKTGVNGLATYNVTKAGQPDGVYMIVEKAHPAVVEPLDPFYVAVPMTDKEDTSKLIYTVDVYPKNELIIPDIKKDVIEIEHIDKSGADEQRVSVNAGEAFTWIVRGDIPADIAAAKLYEITDTLDNALTYAGNMAVKVEAVSADANNSVSSGDAVYENVLLEGPDYTCGISGQTWTVKLTEDGLAKVVGLVGETPEDYELRVYFDTTVDSDAQMGKDIPNQATLKYTNSANFTFEVKSDIPEVYTCGINIYKYDAKNVETPLAGAEFMLAREATAADRADENAEIENLVIARGNYKEVVFVKFYEKADLTGDKVLKVRTDAAGDAVMYGLEEGTYYLVETKAPEGYNLLSYPVEVIVNSDSHVTVDNSATKDVNEDMTIRVANSNRFELPSTGGIGTTIFTLVGAALTLGSGAVLAGKKRKEDEE